MRTFREDGLRRIDELVAAAVDEGQAPGIVAAVATGDSRHVATAGVGTLGGAPVRRDSLFRLASISKPITAAAVLALVGEGALDLDEPIARLLPELAERRVLRRPDGPLDDTVPAHRQPTVRDLLTFTWGFGMQGALFVGPSPWPIVTATVERRLAALGPPDPASTPDPDTWLARFGELPLIAQPGQTWLYSSGSQVLGVLAARATGQPFDEVLRSRVFAPLGLRDTAFWTTDSARLVTAYARQGSELVVQDAPDGAWSRPPLFPDGAGGLLSSVDDVLDFGRALLRDGGGAVPPGLVAAMTRDQLTAEQRRYDWPGFDMLSGRGWGYGVSILDDGRYSWDGGLGTFWSNVPSLDLTVVVLTQRVWDETGPPAVGDAVLAAAGEAVV